MRSTLDFCADPLKRRHEAWTKKLALAKTDRDPSATASEALVPNDARLGQAKVTVWFETWKEGKIALTRGEIRVIAQPKGTN
jgi:hypothetical protein